MHDGHYRNGLNGQLVGRLIDEGAIRSSRVENAFRTVLRHWFVPDAPIEELYRDTAIVTHRGPDGMPVSAGFTPGI